MKFTCFLFVLLFSPALSAQTSSTFDPHSFNQKYLEHLVKIRVDEVRKKYDCKPLVNDSILYVASEHHAGYIQRLGRLSHTEDDSVLTKTPQQRAEYFGAVNYRVGENLVYTPYNSTVENKKGKKFNTDTYEEIADVLVDSWVNSPGHFKNIITPDYQITGLAVSIDPIKKRIYACQKFAVVDFKFEFEENKEFFSYSDYVPPPPITSFEGIGKELIEYDYPYDLRHDKPEKCETYEALLADKPWLTLRVEGNKFILKVENSEYVQKMIRDAQDGFAVEIVTYTDYMCGNPAYYTKPSRRNGQLKLNGFTLEPLYKKDLFPGYKKRKKKKEVRFIPYIFKADSVSFFKRFGQYKIDSYSSEYFEISLGKVPKDIDGFWNHNLVYIQNKQICHIDYFTSFCGELFDDYRTTEFIPLDSDGRYTFLPQKEISQFTIPFEQGQVNFTKEDIEPFTTSMGKLKFNIDSIGIHAYASVEGDSIINQQLQIQRGQNIASLIQSMQVEKIKLNVETSTDWDGFYANAGKSAKWKSLATKSKAEIVQQLTALDPASIEPLLAPTRRGDITIYSTIPVSDQNLSYLIEKEARKIVASINRESDIVKKQEGFTAFQTLYAFAHHLVRVDSLSPEFLAKLPIPENLNLSHQALEQFLLYGYEFEEAYTANNSTWKEKSYSDLIWLLKNSQKSNQLSPNFFYQVARLETERMKVKPPKDQQEVQTIFTLLTNIESSYQLDSSFQKNIDRVNFDLNVILLNHIFTRNPLESGEDAVKSIAQLWEFYKKHDELTDSRAIALAKCAVHYAKVEFAKEMLLPYATTDSILSYYMPLCWNHPSDERWSEYYDYLIELSYSMKIDNWCNLFMGDCLIPFQAFDHESLRNRFCEECMEKNNMILQLQGKRDD